MCVHFGVSHKQLPIKLCFLMLRSQAPKLPAFCISLNFKFLRNWIFSHSIKYKLGFPEQNLVSWKPVVVTEHTVTTHYVITKLVHQSGAQVLLLLEQDTASDAPQGPSASEGAASPRLPSPLQRRQGSSYGSNEWSWQLLCEENVYSSGERIPEGLVLRCIVWANVRALEFTLY